MEKKRTLRKFEYTENTSEYLEVMDDVLLIMNKEFQKEIKKFYSKIKQLGSGLDSVGLAYLIRRLESGDFPQSLKKWHRETLSLWLNARFYDNVLVLPNENYEKLLKNISEDSLEQSYLQETDKIILRLGKVLYISNLNLNSFFLKQTRTKCHPIANNKVCLWLKDDILKAIGERDFRISYHKINKLLPSLMRKF